MFLKIIRFFIGYVSFTASGKSIERFFNLVARSGITIWNMRTDISPKDQKRYASANIIASEYKFLRSIAKKSGLKLKIQKRYGLVFILRRYKKRLGLFIGVALLCLILYVLSLYIWVVRVEGNVELSEEEIKEVVSEMGLKPGVLKKYVNSSYIEHQTMIHFNNLSWASVNIEGCFATVSINEAFKPPEIVPKDKPCNIKAKRSGQIIRMDVYDGTQEVKNGDAVEEGQLLVSGIVENSFGGMSINHASAKAIASTKYEIKKNINFNVTEKIETGKKFLKRRLHLFGLDIPITLQLDPKGEFKVQTKTNVAKIIGVPLPISVYEETWTEQSDIEITLSLDQVKALAEKDLEKAKQTCFEDKKIIREDKEESIFSESYLLTDTIYCEEDIAIEEPLNF